MADHRPSEEPATGERQVRIAAVGDIHFDPARRGSLLDLFTRADQEADILVLCGDLTTHGRPEQMRGMVDEMKGIDIPILAVLGNHDYEGEVVEELTAILSDRGVHVLDGEGMVVQGIGFAGVKGFAGGFGRGSLGPFGERLMKDFVQHTIDEALKLESALRELSTETKVVAMHYAPIPETVQGEPEAIWPFLGSSRLLPPIETHGASVVFHGHAHVGTPHAETPAGVPVYNVALPLLRSEDLYFRIWTVPAPERRRSVA